MATVFCSNCGAKHEYAGFAPNFCSKCGTKFGTTSPQPRENSKIKKTSQESNGEDVESEDLTNIDEIPDLDKLDVEIEMEGGFRAFSLEELSRQPNNAKARKFIPKRHGGIGDLSPIKYGSSKNEEKD